MRISHVQMPILFGWMMAMMGCHAFQLPSSSSSSSSLNYYRRARGTTTTTTTTSSRRTTTSVRSTLSSPPSQKADMDEMRKEIETMKEEALKRLEALNQKMQDHEAIVQQDKEKKMEEELSQQLAHLSSLPSLDVVPSAVSKDDTVSQTFVTSTPLPELTTALEGDFLDEALERRIESDRRREEYLQNPTTSSSSQQQQQQQQQITTRVSDTSTALLDSTRWRLMFNLGREPGTWMPKTWGVSGERLLMNLEMEFTSNPLLYERDDFLNGVSGTKILHVVHNELTVGPNMKEGAKRVRVKDGGWRVAPGEGPAGTDVLRFYVELEEETRHNGSDVYAPAGRLYCTCGYFSMESRTSSPTTTTPRKSRKEELRKEQEELRIQYETLVQEQEDDESLVSWDKVQRAKKLMDLQKEAKQLQALMQEARIQEPEKRSLRLSRDQRVGLTREGGVCCKVPKGLAIEYQILGKFEVAAMDNREHSDYRELLP